MAQCFSPFGVRDKKTGNTIPVPCGKCANCVARKISWWSFRLMQEDRYSLQSWFITLTYDNDHVPITKNKFMTCKKSDVQGFMKRLRYYSPKTPKIKYYAAAEYGSETMRPHYHIIIFNAEERAIMDAWTLGNVHFGTVSAASVGYSLKYISKPQQIPIHARDDRVPEFALMSTGLGKSYLTENMIKWHEDDMYNRMYCTTEEKKKSQCLATTRIKSILKNNVSISVIISQIRRMMNWLRR